MFLACSRHSLAADYLDSSQIPYPTPRPRRAFASRMTLQSHLSNRYPEVQECSWTGSDKCRCHSCRYSLIAERPRINDWCQEDVEELANALPSTCALDMAALGPLLLEEISAYLGLTRPQVEQLEVSGTRKLARMRELRKANWDGR